MAESETIAGQGIQSICARDCTQIPTRTVASSLLVYSHIATLKHILVALEVALKILFALGLSVDHGISMYRIRY